VNNTQRGVILYGLLGIAIMCHTVFIEWRSSNYSVYKTAPIISLYSYEKVHITPGLSLLRLSLSGSETYDKYIFGIYRDQNVGITTTVIIGLVIPFLCFLGALYFYFGTSKENRIKLLGPIITLPPKIKSSIKSFIYNE